MVRPILRHSGEGPSRHPSLTWLVEGILLLRGVCCTVDGTDGAGSVCSGPPCGELSGGKWIVCQPCCSLAPGCDPLRLRPSSVNCSARIRPGSRQRKTCRVKIVTWLILPVVICLSQRLSHACLSISNLYRETANGSLNQLSFI